MLVSTFFAWNSSRSAITELASQKFNQKIKDTELEIQKRMMAYKQVLLGGAGFVAASDSVERGDWYNYIKALEIEKNYPGILGIGYSIVLPKETIKEHIKEVRQNGFPDYDVWPLTQNEIITSIIYLEPFNGRNLRAFGYDMFSEPVRRQAMRQARDSGKAAVSGKVILVQETSKDIQSGFLMYLPVYQKNSHPGTVEERRTSLRSFVYSPFRMNDLMNGILGNNISDILLTIYDDPETSEESLMYNSDTTYNAEKLFNSAEFSSLESIDIEGHKWFVKYSSLPAFEKSIDYGRPNLIITLGIIISFLVFIIILVMAESWKLGLQREQILLSAGEGIFGIDLNGKLTFINQSAAYMLHCNAEDCIHQDLNKVILNSENGAEPGKSKSRIILSTKDGIARRIADEKFVRADRSSFPVEYYVNPIVHRGEIQGAVVTFNDITARLKAEEELNNLAWRLKDTLGSITDAFYTLSHEDVFTYVNKEAEKLLIRNKEELLGKTIWDAFPEAADTLFYKNLTIAKNEKRTVDFEEFYPKLNGWFEIHLYPSNNGLSVFFRDINKRKEAEEQIAASLKEKDVLLKEIHHRVKNNLQVVASLLRLQIRNTEEERAIEILKESQNRIRSMALIHEKLYMTKDMSKINFSVYVNDLAGHLLDSYSLRFYDVDLLIDIEDIPIGLDEIVALGLIINELISNSIKHGFKNPDGKVLPGAKINISMSLCMEGNILLSVEDNGKGMPADVDFRKTNSLGLQLVDALVQQLEGTIDLEKCEGTKFVIIFPFKDTKKNNFMPATV